MAAVTNKNKDHKPETLSAAPRGTPASEIQPFNQMVKRSIALASDVRQHSVQNLNQLLADTITLRDLYKKHHWQVSGPLFYELHLLFDKHYQEQDKLVDMVAERIMMLGGVSLAMGADVARAASVPHPPLGREPVPSQIARLLEAHEIVLKEAHEMAESAAMEADEGTNDLLVSDVIRTNELQTWFVGEHVADVPDSRSDRRESPDSLASSRASHHPGRTAPLDAPGTSATPGVSSTPNPEG